MKKNKQYGLRHTVFEADFANTDDVKWGETWTVDDMCKLIEKRIRWAKDNLCFEGRNFLNMRDIARVMRNSPLRMFKIIKYLAEMPKEYRLYGMIFEEPVGDCMPEQVRLLCYFCVGFFVALCLRVVTIIYDIAITKCLSVLYFEVIASFDTILIYLGSKLVQSGTSWNEYVWLGRWFITLSYTCKNGL